jgi:hypothetical protein
MKARFPLLALALALMATASAETAQEVYARGVRAYIGGDADTAKALFTEVLAADPSNKPAAAYLRRIQLEQSAGVNLEKQAASVIVPKVDFRDASLSSVLTYLAKLSREQSKGAVTLNIVGLYPPAFGEQTRITLSLSNAPLSEVLKYVSEMAGTKLEYQQHAIVVSKSAGS